LGITCHERLKEEFEWISFQTSVCGAQNDKLWATFERSGKIRQQSMRGSFCPRRARLLLGGGGGEERDKSSRLHRSSSLENRKICGGSNLLC